MGSRFFSMFSAPEPAVKQKVVAPPPVQTNKGPKGLYIYGNPGSGKTFTMELFYQNTKIAKKKKVHFNMFMLDVHQRIHELEKQMKYQKSDPVGQIALQISRNTRLLCFDEFQVTDIADAMIIARLFRTMMDGGLVMVATSNRPPDELYWNGLNRNLFLPFIELLKQRCECVNIDSATDYRYSDTGKTKQFDTYFYPNDEKAKREVKNIFQNLTGKEIGEMKELEVMQGRTITCYNAAGGVAQFSFDQLCKKAVGASDFIAISQNFHTVILTDIPQITGEDSNSLRRFILLIDELYNHKVNVICTAEVARGQLSQFIKNRQTEESFAFDRTLSRLMEMQTAEYIESPHIPHPYSMKERTQELGEPL